MLAMAIPNPRASRTPIEEDRLKDLVLESDDLPRLGGQSVNGRLA